MNIFKTIWSWISSAFMSFVKQAVDQLTQKLIVSLKDFAVQAVTRLSTTDLTSAEKRKEAFDLIKAEAIAKGLEYKDSAIYLLIEICVAKIKSNENK